ncbi:mandelate racemase/muconate lactonizing enzyme family protein [Ruania sp. N2-46]|uniref:Mandelate racemase/muconate lactonizing enzyme family protein n=2 Tax=Occultella gossypii TaxID=2800820 RepID=A0ABS7SC46_9MICO|nr:mandelate racemase/muconate lactonizing enzyme family protein [Occultella gossypii]
MPTTMLDARDRDLIAARDRELPISAEHVSQASRPSALRITDLRVACLDKVPFKSTIIRIETNQGLVGWGEVRDQASATYALMLKSRIIGENPCNLDRILRKIRQFGGHGRLGGGVSGVEMALMDLAGKAYGVPAYALMGGQFRDRIKCYADTPGERDPHRMAERLKGRLDAGYTMLKMDVGVDLLDEVPNALVGQSGAMIDRFTPHPFTALQISQAGVDHLVDYVRTVRAEVGYDVPIAVDHIGHVDLKSCIRIAQALEPFGLAWLEDLIPWQYTEQWKKLTDSTTTPTATGEDIYLAEGFRPLLDAGAVDVVHPDPATAGGLVETKRIGDLAEEYGVPMALHLAASPVATMACVQIAAATYNFLALEHHGADVEYWSDLVLGFDGPIIAGGYIQVPDKPGLGFDDVNLDLMRECLDQSNPIFFDDSSVWDSDVALDRTWG